MRSLKENIAICILLLCCKTAPIWGQEKPDAWPPEYLKDLPADRLERAHAGVEHAHGFMTRLKFSDAAGSDFPKEFTEKTAYGLLPWVQGGIGAFISDKPADIATINRYLASDKLAKGDFNAARPSGYGAFATTQLRFYGLFNSHTGKMRGKLDPAGEQNFQAAMLRILNDYSKLEYTKLTAQNYWNGSQNRYIPSVVGYLLVSQWLRDNPTYKSYKLKDGSTLQEQYQGWRAWVSKLLDQRMARGLWQEVGEGYEDGTIAGIANIRDFAEDPVLRKKAEMLLDLHFASRAEEMVLNTHGGPKSRSKGTEPYLGTFAGHRDYNMLFGNVEAKNEKVPLNAFTTSDYLPPPVIFDMAADSENRGTYAFAKRAPGAAIMSDGKMRDAEGNVVPDGWVTSDMEKTVIRYGFAGRNYMVSSTFVDPRWLDGADRESRVGPTISGEAFRWAGAVFKVNGKEARIGYETKPNSNGWHANGQHFSLQHRNIFIIQRWVPEGANINGDKLNPSFLKIYFSQTLDEVTDGDNGWIFARSGDAYAAVKVVAGGYKWIKAHPDKPAEVKPTTWTHGEKVDLNDLKFALLNENVPAIFIVNDASDYDDDFSKFKAAVKAQPMDFDAASNTTKFANLTFFGPAKVGQIDGKTVDLFPKLGYDSPFIRSEWASGLIYIRKGDKTEILDVRDSQNPVKTVGAPVTADFPPGVGSDKPIIFGAGK